MPSSARNNPLRGEIYWVQFDPSVGEEIRKTRPAIVVSNDKSNRNTRRYQVVPLTTNTQKLYPCEASVDIDGKKSKAMADHLQTASILRFGNRIGQVSAKDMRAVDDAIRLQLGLSEVE